MGDEHRRGVALQDIGYSAMKRVLAANSHIKPPIVNHVQFGATNVDAKHLALWLIYDGRAAKQEARRNGDTERLTRELREALREEGYPSDAIPHVFIGFADMQSIEEEGGMWNYFK